jgi:hypothetical protein
MIIADYGLWNFLAAACGNLKSAIFSAPLLHGNYN